MGLIRAPPLTDAGWFYGLEEGEIPDRSGAIMTRQSSGGHLPSSSDLGEMDGYGHHWVCSNGSLLSFQQGAGETRCSDSKIDEGDGYSSWVDNIDNEGQWNHLGSAKGAIMESRLAENLNSSETATGGNMARKEARPREEQVGWLYPGEAAAVAFTESGSLQVCSKRPYMVQEDETQASKMHCVGVVPRTNKGKPVSSKHPQSIAAKNRRERISERLKILQDLVPNGTKVDLVTMLEKAISYVKCLQLQVKVLATDELWPAAGGKAPEVAQVKEAIDAILSSSK